VNFLANLKIASTLGLVVAYSIVNADQSGDLSEFGQCLILKPNQSSKITTISNNPVEDAIYLEADAGNIRIEGTSRLDGNVIIQQNNTVFNADHAEINRETETVNAKGNVILTDSKFQLNSPSIEYNLKNKSGTIENADYSLGEQGVHGKSSQIKQIDENRLILKDATFTSCPVSQESWYLASSEIKLDNKSQIGTAKNVTFNVGKVPVFYFPWLNFPINNQRLSGFLTPSVRLQSNAGITLPYYFNIAPNYDATVSFASINGKGYQLDTEFRYLSENNKGTIEYNFIPQDKSFNNKKRDYFKIEHRTKFNDKTRLNLEAENVSDVDFFDDFSTSLESSTRPALQRRLEILRQDKPWTASVAVEDFQVIDTNDNPYAKLPEIKLGYSPKSAPKELKLEIDSELIHFDKKNEITGTRGDLKLKLSKKWGEDSWYLKPSLSVQHTLYSLDSKSSVSSINRTLPTLTLDSGLFFDRDFKSGKYTQTLEPRVFYTYTPFKDQSDIPIFDTTLTNFSESNQLFLENRFTGKDRIADTNKLTFAVTSRIQDRLNGKELFKASIGQVFNFSDRKVTLPGGTILTGKRSDLILELAGRLNDNFRLVSTASLNSEDRSISSYDLRLNYQDYKKRIANISFRKLDDELEQLSLSGSLPISDKWSMVASVDQDIKNSRNLETLAGIEYQDCCWKTRLVVKRYLTSDNISYETPIFLEFELKGLGNIGTSATRQIKEKIYGYDDF
jgi:LPS-assembly protein